MNKTELQIEWDKCLIAGWERNWKYAGVGFQFVRRVAPILEKLGDFSRIQIYITSLELDRCMERVSGEMTYNANGSARSFIDRHSRQLTNFLYSDKHPNEEILKNISAFKWKKLNISKISGKRVAAKQKKQRAAGAHLFVKARELDKNFDWDTVK